MPPLRHQHLPRYLETGTTFSIAFGVIAGAVVFVCAIWGFVIPRWRKKHPASPSRTKWNDGSILTSRKRPSRRIRTFPSHPAIKPLLSKPSTAQILPTYDPRVESPFPDSPGPGLTRSFPVVVSRFHSVHSAPTLPTNISSEGLFTPVRHNTKEDQSKNDYHTVPRAKDAKHFVGRSADFGDAKDFILAVPEPLALKPRDAGRPPAVKRHLEKYGPSHSNSPAGSDKLPHPNKLFRAIQSGDVRSSVCSSTSLRIDHRESDAAALAAKEVEDAVNRAIKEETEHRQYLTYSSGSSKVSPKVRRHDGTAGGEHSMTALHQLRSYRSLTGSRVPALTRAGTLTRPKTPVDELKKFYNQGMKKDTIPMGSLPHELTTSTAFTAIENSSENDSLSTPATSPTLPPNNLKLLPTPLRPRKSSETMPSVGIQGFSRSGTMHSTDTEEGLSGVPPLQSVLGRRRGKRLSRGFYHTGRQHNNPAPLAIQTCKVSSPRRHQPQRSLTEFGTAVVAPLLKPSQLKSRMRASSMYSQDTHGFNLMPTPTSPDFQSPLINICADQDVYGNPFTGRESVKARVEEWTQRMHGLPTPPLPSSKHLTLDEGTDAGKPEVKKNIVDNKTTHETMTTDVLHQYDSTIEGNTVSGRGQAPGGAIWI